MHQRLLYVGASALLCGGCGTLPSRPSFAPGVPVSHQRVRRLLGDTTWHWRRHTTRHFRLHAPADSYGSRHLNMLGLRAEQALSADLDLLEVAHQDHGAAMDLDVVFLPSRTEMERALVFRAGGYAEVEEQNAFFIAD